MMDWTVDLATFRSPASPMICRGYRRKFWDEEAQAPRFFINAGTSNNLRIKRASVHVVAAFRFLEILELDSLRSGNAKRRDKIGGTPLFGGSLDISNSENAV